MAEQLPTAIPSTQEQNESPTYGTVVWVSYKIDIRTRLRSSFRSLARFLRIMPQPSHDLFEEFRGLKEEKTRFSDVLAYYYFLSSLYKSAATYSLDRNRWRVTRISTYKASGIFEHESLVADVECEGAKVYLRFERNRSDKSSKSSPKTPVSEDSDPSPDVTDPPQDTRPTGGSSSNKKAEDAITLSSTLKTLIKRSECVETIQFSEGKGLSLSQIAVLARCVNSMEETYSVFKANCYWFAHLVVGAAKLIESDFTVVEVRSKKKVGEWKNLFPFKPEEMIEKVKLEYDKQWVEFNDDIYKSVNNENSEIYKAERRKREEAEHKREEAERLEQEERRKREEEERKREEAERLEQEERRKREEAERKAEEAEEEIKKLRAQLAAAQASNGANSSS